MSSDRSRDSRKQYAQRERDDVRMSDRERDREHNRHTDASTGRDREHRRQSGAASSNRDDDAVYRVDPWDKGRDKEARKERKQRKRSPPRSSSAQPPTDKNNLENLMATMATTMSSNHKEVMVSQKSVEGKIGNIEGAIGHIESGLKSVQSDVHDLRETSKAHDDKLARAFERLSVLESENAKWKTAHEEVQQRMAKAEAAVPVIPLDSSFIRPPNPSVLKANAKNIFAAGDLQKAVDRLLDEAELGKGIAKVMGKGTGRKFKIQFLGAGQIPVVNAQKFLDCVCKDSDGEWVPLFVEEPQGAQQRMYISLDCSPQQERIQMLTNALAKVVSGVLGKEAFARKADGVVSVDFEPVACLDVPDAKTVNILFNLSTCSEIGLDTVDVQARFDAGGRKKVAWAPSP